MGPVTDRQTGPDLHLVRTNPRFRRKDRALMRIAKRSMLVLLTGTLLLAGLTGTALANKRHHRGSATGSFSLVLLDSTDGTPHWSQDVTFDVTSTATYPFVDLDCYQSGTLVYHQGVGFYAGYPFSQIFTLKNWKWQSGAADCNATLYSTNADGSNYTVLSTKSIHVYA
jgi:hypothetical protein